ncbi:MAG: hypothetical protein KJ067_09850 [Vicinamibacteria bacterium]|nr:hypothetical protein [Vicinamibacteria bacterium]
MSRETPDHHDADLVLRVYEMRREAVMRESRTAISRDFWPKSYDDLLAISKPDHPHNAAFRQVATYWEMVYGLVRHHIVHGDYFMENNGEGMYLYAKVAPYLEQYRKDFSPTSFRSAEYVAKNTAEGRRLFEMFTARVAKVLAAK